MITHSAAATGAIGDIAMPLKANQSGLRAEFSSSLLRAFASQNVSRKASSRWVADFAVSSQPSKTTVVPVGQEQKGIDPSASSGIEVKWFHVCEPERLKGTLAVFDREANTLVGKAEGHLIACPGDRSEIDLLAAMLVRSVTGKPETARSQE